MLDQCRYVEYRRDGEDPVGTFSARRISPELRQWIVAEARQRGCSHRKVVEDAVEGFLNYRENSGDFPYNVIPRNVGRIYRQVMKIDLLTEALEAIARDGVHHGDFLTAALKYEMSKDGEPNL